jgi:hypothetical protein
MNRQQRRASERQIKKLGTLAEHFAKTLRDVRAEFERDGDIGSGFNCFAGAEAFSISNPWPTSEAKPAAYAALRDTFRRRGVNRYLCATECWGSQTLDVRPSEAPDRIEYVKVIGVERGGARKCALAEITRNGETATLGPWQAFDDIESWLFELLEEGHSDRGAETKPMIPEPLSPATRASGGSKKSKTQPSG